MTKAVRIVRFVSVDALAGHFGFATLVITVQTHVFSIIFSVNMWALKLAVG